MIVSYPFFAFGDCLVGVVNHRRHYKSPNKKGYYIVKAEKFLWA